jgi:hypothetical protein
MAAGCLRRKIGTMDSVMTLGTFGCKRAHPAFTAIPVGDGFTRRRGRVSGRAHSGGVEVKTVTLQAEVGFILLEQVVGDGAVRVVADHTIFHYRLMLEDERALVARVALQAKIAFPFFGVQHTGAGAHVAVYVVTTGAGHFTLANRVMRRIQHLGANFGVASGTQFHLLKGLRRLTFPFVNGVAFGTGHSILSMRSVRPFGKISGAVTFQALGIVDFDFVLPERENVSGIIGFHVALSGTVATFTSSGSPVKLKIPQTSVHVMQEGRVNAFVALGTHFTVAGEILFHRRPVGCQGDNGHHGDQGKEGQGKENSAFRHKASQLRYVQRFSLLEFKCPEK